MAKKSKSNKNFKIGDTIYFKALDGIYSAVITDIDKNDFILANYDIIRKAECLDKNDPRIKECKGDYIDAFINSI